MFENFERVTTKKVTQFMITRKLIANIWRTPTGEILQSKHRHDLQVDSAGNYIDGGIEGYTRRGGDILNENGRIFVYILTTLTRRSEKSSSGSPTERTSRSLMGFTHC